MFDLNGMTVYLHRAPIDFRKSINGLAALVEQGLKLDPFSSACFVFSNQRRDKVKILFWQRNGYEAYNAATQALRLTHLGCWVHARRGFIEAEAALPKKQRDPQHPATQMIALIGELYLVEKKADEQNLTAEQRTTFRQQHSVPILAKIRTELEIRAPQTLPQSPLGKAYAYLHHQWPKLIHFTENGLWPLDNNLAENAIRPFVVGRKNWLCVSRRRTHDEDMTLAA